jgi:hypothetical protein
MKKLHDMRTILLPLVLSFLTVALHAQEAEKPELMVNLGYYTENNSTQYLKAQTQIKANNKLQPVKNAVLRIYLNSVGEENLIANLKTDEKGKATTAIPPRLRDQWAASTDHKFIAVAKANPKDEEVTTELEIAKAKIVIDTLNEEGVRSVTATVLSYNDGEWLPAKDVEVKLGVRRLGAQLKIGEDESYTTDSLGNVAGEFKLDSLPADDSKGAITLVARIEDNEQFGNITMEKTVPWGKYYVRENNFGKRSLWAARFRSPLWLVFMAYSIVAGVWGVIFYLVFSIIKIKKLSKKDMITQHSMEMEGMLVD